MSSFQKRGNQRSAKIPGTKPSLHTGQTIVSSGIPSLDHVLDGGIPVGSLVVIEEDIYGDYARLVLGYFMTEGVCNQQPLFIASRDTQPKQMALELPSPVDYRPAAVQQRQTADSGPPADGDDQKMTIAWRYQNLPQASTPISGRFGQHYDLGQFLDQSVIDAADVCFWEPNHSPSPTTAGTAPSGVTSLLQSCHDFLLSPEPATPHVGRAVVHALGSPLWDLSQMEVVRCCQLLRAICRLTSSVAMVTVPTHLWTDTAAVARLRGAGDICLGLESFQGTAAASNPAFSDYHGLLLPHRLSSLHTLAAHYPSSTDLAFKVRRKKFCIETLHLPPELSETVSRSQEEDSTPRRQAASAGLCQASRPGGPLDF